MVDIIDLPEELLDKIMRYLSYEEIANSRQVCRRFDRCGQRLLNIGFKKALRDMLGLEIPANELSGFAKLQMAQMMLMQLCQVYYPFERLKMVCFIPGKITDQINQTVTLYKTDPRAPQIGSLMSALETMVLKAQQHFTKTILPRLLSKLESAIERSDAFDQQNNTINDLKKQLRESEDRYMRLEKEMMTLKSGSDREDKSLQIRECPWPILGGLMTKRKRI